MILLSGIGIFAQSVGDERESSQVNLSELLQLFPCRCNRSLDDLSTPTLQVEE
jgi:hypothetical protein